MPVHGSDAFYTLYSPQKIFPALKYSYPEEFSISSLMACFVQIQAAKTRGFFLDIVAEIHWLEWFDERGES